jgi:hypothetical protein
MKGLPLNVTFCVTEPARLSTCWPRTDTGDHTEAGLTCRRTVLHVLLTAEAYQHFSRNTDITGADACRVPVSSF